MKPPNIQPTDHMSIAKSYYLKPINNSGPLKGLELTLV